MKTEATTFTATIAGETFTRRSTLELTHAVLAVHGERATEIAAIRKWFAKWGDTGEAVLVRTSRKRLALLESCDSRFVHRVVSWHTSEALAHRKRRLGEVVVAVTATL